MVAAKNRFRTIDGALKRAGIRDWPERLTHPPLSRKRTLAGLRARHRRGESLHFDDIATDDYQLINSAMRHFAALSRALEAARLPVERRYWKRDKIVRALRRRLHRGLSVHARAVALDDPALHSAAQRAFGNWKRIEKLFGVEPLRESWTRRKVIQALREKARRGIVTTGMVPKALALACRRHFGSFGAARRAARLRPARS